MKKTFLEITKALHQYAAAYGAQQDPQSKQWFVVGEVPTSLLNFVPKEARQAIPEYGPSCPICRAFTKKRYFNGNAFWGCSRYPTCRGTAEWEYGTAKQIVSAAAQSRILKADPNTDMKSANDNKLDTALLRPRWEAIVASASEVLGSPAAAQRWLDTPKVTLRGLKPCQVIGTIEGCERVEKLLDSLSD